MSGLPRKLVAVAVAIGLAMPASGVAFAQGDAKAADAPSKLALASAAWERMDLQEAVPLYEKALTEGGLFPADVVVAYARIGTVRAATGKKDAALSAFRIAAALDPSFQLPGESGPKAKPIFEVARKEAAERGGKLTITAVVPDKVDAGDSFTVKTRLAEAFAPLVDKVGIEVKDTSGKGLTYQEAKAADPQVSFEVPAKYAVAGTTLLVRVAALDPHANRWAMQETKVKVSGSATAPGPIAADGATTASGAAVDEDDDSIGEHKKKSKGFFDTPWPYVIGGVIIAGAVTAFVLTRPSSNATVGAPRWN